MEKRPIQTGTPLGPYSPAMEVKFAGGTMLFVSGQIGIDTTGSLVSAEFGAQAEQVFLNLSAILEKAGRGFSDVVKVTIFLTDLANFAMVNELCKQYFKEPYPARATVQVAALPKGAQVEIEVTALSL